MTTAFNEDTILVFLKDYWNPWNVTKPALFTKNAMLADYANSLFVKRHKLPSAWVAAGLKRSMEYYEFQLKCITKDDIDELVRLLDEYSYSLSEETAFLDIESPLGNDAAFAGWTRGGTGHYPVQSTTVHRGSTGSYSVKPETGYTSYCEKHDWNGLVRECSAWIYIDTAGANDYRVHVLAAQYPSVWVAGQWKISDDMHAYYDESKSAGGHDAGAVALDTWFKLGMVLHDSTQIVDYYLNDVLKGSHAYKNVLCVATDGFKIINNLGNWEWYFDDVEVVISNSVDVLSEKPEIQVEYMGQDQKHQHTWRLSMYVVKYE